MAGLFSHMEGEPGRPPVVLLHGFGGHHSVWTSVRRALGPAVPTIAYDLPGHGNSLGMRESAAPRRAAGVILDDLSRRDVMSFHLVGHSMGGAIATLMAIAEPSRVASLTLLAPGGFGETINEAALRALAAAASADELAEALEPMCAQGHVHDMADLAAMAAMRALPGQSEVLKELVGRIAKDGRQGMIPRDLIAGLPMPVTVVWGEEDQVLDPRHADGLPTAIAVRRIAGRGHMLPEECPDEVAMLIRRATAS